MTFQDLIKKRYSVRGYKSDPVDDRELELVLEAARLAPTACNLQPFRFVILRTAGRQDELKRIYPQPWFTQAPLIIGICGVLSEGWVRRDRKIYVDVDAAIAMDHLILAATDLGLGTCWIAAFDPAAAREILKLPAGVEPIAFTPLGHPADAMRPKRRKPLSELVRYDRW